MNGDRALVVLAAIAVIFLLYWGEPFFVPLFIALIISYALSPAVDTLTVVVRHRAVAAAFVVVLILSLGALAAWTWSDDVEALWNRVPVAAKSISRSLQKFAQRPGSTVAEVKRAAQEMETIGSPRPPQPAAPPPSSSPGTQASIPVWQVLWKGWLGVMTAAGQVTAVTFLVFFMLASGDLFKRKLVAMAGSRLAERKDAVKVIDEIDLQIRRYLGVLLVADVLVGLGTWLAFRILGVEYAELWGLGAGLLHTAPYFGPALVAAGSLVAAFVQFGEWSKAFAAAGASVAISMLVGMLFATWLASRTTRMNTTAAFVGLLFFGWLWGFWGVLLAIPLLAIVKTICDHNDDWKPLADLLGQ